MDDLQSLQKELASLRSEVDAALREKDKHIKKLRAEVASMEKYQKAYNVKTDNLIKKLDNTLSAKIENLRRSISHLTQQTNGLENRISSVEREARRTKYS